MTTPEEPTGRAGRREPPAAPGPPRDPRSGASQVLRVLALGIFYAALVVALALFGRTGKAFIYQGF